jgi:hypothetical protein
VHIPYRAADPMRSFDEGPVRATTGAELVVPERARRRSSDDGALVQYPANKGDITLVVIESGDPHTKRTTGLSNRPPAKKEGPG